MANLWRFVTEIEGHVNKKHILSSNDSKINKMEVNSYHNHGIRRSNIGKDLDIIAYSEDGFVEAYKSKKLNILGIQWHPERQFSDVDKELIIEHLTECK